MPLESAPGEGDTISSKVPPAPDAGAASPPKVPSAPRDGAESPNRNGRATNKRSAPSSTNGGAQPHFESAPESRDLPSDERRSSFRYVTPASPSTRRNVLAGRVETDAGDPREGVRVVISNRNQPGLERTGMSDAFGEFAVRLEDGDWTVRVIMPSGRIYPLRQVNARNGHVVDDSERREIPNLIITY
jgi:hypothetical protein